MRSLYLALLAAGVWWVMDGWTYIHAQRCRQRIPTQRDSKPLWMASITLLLIQAALLPWQGSGSLLTPQARQAPIGALLHNTYEVLQATTLTANQRDDDANDENPYPFEKRAIYTQSLPFPATGDTREKNLIVIFSEGLSARLIGAYGGGFAELTPNIDRLAARSMRVLHYYNHTAATYRGLQGQLTSGYPWAGGAGDAEAWDSTGQRNAMMAIHYRSVPMILRELGYNTTFVSPHHDTVSLNTMLRALGFNRVVSFDEVSQQIAPGNPMYAVEGALGDAELFHALNVMMQRHQLAKPGQSFFAGLYNFGTHAFLDVQAFGLKYRDGSNPALNKLHNYDHALGTFLDAFFASPYAQNTILVFTSDHATFPDPAYRQVTGEDFKPYFVDQVPLLIYDPFHRLPATYDAHGRTSIDLAPTLLQLLGVRRADNSFLGTSLFEHDQRPFGFSAIGSEFYASDADGVYAESSVPARYQKQFATDRAKVQTYYRLERENRVFKP
jgi:phosphoglycerol transferase MdoB-like AlkP superfamily enzyme